MIEEAIRKCTAETQRTLSKAFLRVLRVSAVSHLFCISRGLPE